MQQEGKIHLNSSAGSKPSMEKISGNTKNQMGRYSSKDVKSLTGGPN